MSDLFGDSPESIALPIPDGCLVYYPFLDVGFPHDTLLEWLITRTPWRQEEITVWGKRHLQPRLIAWYGDNTLDYTYSGIHLNPSPWNENLLIIRNKIQEISGEKFNSVLLNYYRDERDSMGFHSDDEPELGESPTIASFSLGEVRTLIFKSKNDKSLKPIKLPLQSGSLLIMSGETQKNWLHGIEKTTTRLAPRVNLTFRKIITNSNK